MSLEFNRFLEYYKNAEDLNLPEKPERNDKRPNNRGKNGRREDYNPQKSERNARSNDRNGGFKRGQRVRMVLNFGYKQNASPRNVLGIINDITRDKSISIGDIEIAQRCTFFDVYADQADRVLDAFAQNGGNMTGEIVSHRNRNEAKPFRPDKSKKKHN